MEERDQFVGTLDEDDSIRLRATINPDAVSIDLVSAFAGDRPMTKTETAHLQNQIDKRGKALFSDLLFAVSHHYFARDIAVDIWDQVLLHKFMMSEKLGRNVRITVATLDYLANITGVIGSATLMSETYCAEITNLSIRDGLTGLFNHSTFYELLDLELRSHKRYKVGLAVILLDIDNFKAVNDHMGHQEGDRILVELARTLKRETRDADICCRFGGEEFAIILPFTKSPSEALMIAERIRLGATRISSSGQNIAISAGVALGDTSNLASHDLVEQADRALYQAKENGKNQVVMSHRDDRPRDIG